MVRSTIRRMMALALVPPQFISTLFENLANDLDHSERDDLAPLFTYFTNYWLSRTSMWNVFDVPDRTNNFSEGMLKQNDNYKFVIKTRIFLGYNNRFSNRLEKAHPNIWYFIDAIRKEVDTVHSLIVQINSGMRPRKKRLITRIAQDRTNELYDRFNNNTITMQQLLHELSFFVPND